MSPLAKFTPVSPNDKKISASMLNRMQTAIARLANTRYNMKHFDVLDIGGLRTVSIRRSFISVSMNKLTLAVTSISGSVVNISAGNITHGTVMTAVSSANITVNGGTDANPHYIYIQYHWRNATVSLPSPATATLVKPNSTHFQKALFAFKRVGPDAVLVAAHHPGGDIVISGAFA